MSKYTPAWIEIGGDLVISALDSLLLIVEQDALTIDEWEGNCPTRDDLIVVSEQGRTLCLYNVLTPFGQFKELEAFCTRCKLPYRRSSDAFADCDAEIVQHNPLAKFDALCLGTQNSEPAITLSDLRKHQEADRTLEEIIAILARFQVPLPPFHLVPTPDQRSSQKRET